MHYYISYDGDWREDLGENLKEATEVFEEAIRKGDFCPILEDEEGVVLVSYVNDIFEDQDYGVIIGPQVDRDWERDYGGYGQDRIAEEHDYKFGEWRL